MLVDQRAMEALDDAVGLRPLHAALAVLDALELEEQLVGMAVHAPQNSRPLSDSTVFTSMPCASKVGSIHGQKNGPGGDVCRLTLSFGSASLIGGGDPTKALVFPDAAAVG